MERSIVCPPFALFDVLPSLHFQHHQLLCFSEKFFALMAMRNLGDLHFTSSPIWFWSTRSKPTKVRRSLNILLFLLSDALHHRSPATARLESALRCTSCNRVLHNRSSRCQTKRSRLCALGGERLDRVRLTKGTMIISDDGKCER